MIRNASHFFDSFFGCTGAQCWIYQFVFLGVPVVVLFYFGVGAIFVWSALSKRRND